MAVIQGSDNVFEDLGFEPEEAANLKVRADLMLDLRQYVQERRWTQAEAAVFFRETQPRISMKGEISRFSIDKLVNMLARAGMRIRVEVEKVEKQGRGKRPRATLSGNKTRPRANSHKAGVCQPGDSRWSICSPGLECAFGSKLKRLKSKQPKSKVVEKPKR